jgi:hypothetical protein
MLQTHLDVEMGACYRTKFSIRVYWHGDPQKTIQNSWHYRLTVVMSDFNDARSQLLIRTQKCMLLLFLQEGFT